MVFYKIEGSYSVIDGEVEGPHLQALESFYIRYLAEKETSTKRKKEEIGNLKEKLRDCVITEAKSLFSRGTSSCVESILPKG